MDHAIKQLKSEGFKPMYVWGGGHGLPGSKHLLMLPWKQDSSAESGYLTMSFWLLALAPRKPD